MSVNNPVIFGGISASGGIVLLKAIINLGLALHWWTKDQANAWADFTDIAAPILIVWVATLWAARKTTSLDKPRDVDGTPLIRPDSKPALKELEGLQTEAIKINKEITRGL